MRKALLSAAILGGLSAGASAQPPATAPGCDRACLEGYIDNYLVAMMNKDVNDELFAREVKFTENGVRLPLGNEGLWYGMSGTDGYKFYVPDIETQQVAFIGTVKENMSAGAQDLNDGSGNNVAVAIRLRIEQDKITEVEQLAIRPDVQLGGGGARGGGAGRGGAAAGGAAGGRGGAAAGGRGGAGGGGGGGGFGAIGDNVLALGRPHEMFEEAIPENERHTRDELVTIGNYYFTALARHDSQGYYPFTEDCVRIENGIVSTTDCLANFTGTQLNNIVDRIRDRRFVAVDVERGIAFAFAFFDHYRINWTWQLAELFKIENGKIRRVEAVFDQAPFGIQSGWSTYEMAISEDLQNIR